MDQSLWVLLNQSSAISHDVTEYQILSKLT